MFQLERGNRELVPEVVWQIRTGIREDPRAMRSSMVTSLEGETAKNNLVRVVYVKKTLLTRQNSWSKQDEARLDLVNHRRF